MSHHWWANQPGGGECSGEKSEDDTTYGICDLDERKCKFRSADCGYYFWCFDEDENLIVRDYECYANEDCRVIRGPVEEISQLQTINSKIAMKCENNKCISRNSYLWS